MSGKRMKKIRKIMKDVQRDPKSDRSLYKHLKRMFGKNTKPA